MRICEMFRSIQGEGLMIGSVTYFIRTVGCNLSCEWCDTRYSRDGGEEVSVEELIFCAKDETNICVTGGEPLLQDGIYELLYALLESGKNIVLETNGSVDISNVPVSERLIISMDIKCPSSGMNEMMNLSNLKYLKPTDQLKFIIADGSDLEHAISFIESHNTDCNIIFSPVGGMDIEPLTEEVVERNLNVRVLPQLHKIIWGNKRSV
ncbi:MAG: radical SAM protein [Methanomassiliicoccaceae archaeon]|jgi:7-carboxy-7-deazaguanine synthase|nr:radical SAM protein [Methanomassiliicoccaceae archaeon]